MNKTATVTKKDLKQLAYDIGDVMEIVELITDLINYMPNVKESKVQEAPLFYYGKVQETLSNVFEINQGLYKTLDNVASELYDMADELEVK